MDTVIKRFNAFSLYSLLPSKQCLNCAMVYSTMHANLLHSAPFTAIYGAASGYMTLMAHTQNTAAGDIHVLPLIC